MSPRRLGLSTTAIHGAPSRRPDWTPVSPSIVQSATYTNPVGSDEDVLYTGSGNTPTPGRAGPEVRAARGRARTRSSSRAGWAPPPWRISPCSGPATT